MSQEQMSFVVYKCKKMISTGVFFIFYKLIFQSVRGKRAKNSPKWQKNSVCHALYLRNHTLYDCDFWYRCVKWWHLQIPPDIFFIFSFIHFFFIFNCAITCTNQEKGGLGRRWKACPKVKLHGLILLAQNSKWLIQNSF